MNAQLYRSRLFGLFPELGSAGGVQEAGRLTAVALHEIAREREWLLRASSLNDPAGTHSVETGEFAVPFRGFARGKIHFSLDAIGQAALCGNRTAGAVIAAHPFLAVPARCMKAISPKLKVIVIAHGVEVWTPLSSSRRKALLAADLILAPSQDTAEKLVHVQGVAPAKVRQLPWPLSPSLVRMAADPDTVRLPKGFPEGRVILTVGRWAASERYKGQDELIRAVAQLRAFVPNLFLVAVGTGDDLTRLRTLARDLEASDRVQFFENLSREEIAGCYARAEIFALPSSGEGFGLVFLEAMAFSKPVVGASCGGTLDVVENGVNGLLVPPHNVTELGRAIAGLLQSEELRTRLGRCGSELVRREFRFETFRNRLEGFLADQGLAS